MNTGKKRLLLRQVNLKAAMPTSKSSGLTSRAFLVQTHCVLAMVQKQRQWSRDRKLAALGGCSVLFYLMIQFLVATIINYQVPTDLFLPVEEPIKEQQVNTPLPQINQKGILLVKHFEGLYLTPYRCPSGLKTVGYGHTGKKAREGRKITKAEAEALLQQDLENAAAVVRKSVKVPLNSNQFSVLVSFTFNVGGGAFQRSTLLKLVNKQDFAGAAAELTKWVHGNKGRKLQGLVLRRQAERKLFEEPTGNEF